MLHLSRGAQAGDDAFGSEGRPSGEQGPQKHP